MYSNILVPTDGSAGMERVVEHALKTARRHDGTVHALYVVDSGSVTGVPMEASWSGIAETLEREGELALKRVERLVDDDLGFERAIREGDPSREIVAYTVDHDIDQVVMGTHGRGGLDRLLLGSVAERVVRAASIPVTTVRLDTGERAAGDSPMGRDTDRGPDERRDDHPSDYTPDPEPGAR
jgi:nucleotide-binding universal stress UspA family protein